jgi:hypothetical protein
MEFKIVKDNFMVSIILTMFYNKPKCVRKAKLMVNQQIKHFFKIKIIQCYKNGINK